MKNTKQTGKPEKKEYSPVTNKTFDNFSLDTWQSWASSTWGEKLTKDEVKELIQLYYESNHIDINDPYKANIKPDLLTGTWFDIKRTDVLNNRQGTAMGDEKHIAPLQLKVIQRAIQMWTNPEDIVFTPFLGIGSEVYQAVKLNRFGIGIELKESYFNAAKRNIDNVIENKNQLALF